MFGPASRRAFLLLALSLAPLPLAPCTGCKCPETTPPPPVPPPNAVAQGTGGSSGPPVVRGRAAFYTPNIVKLDVSVNENERPLRVRTMDVWWDSHDGTGPVFKSAPNASFTKGDLANPYWEVDEIPAEFDPTDSHFRVRVIVWDKNGVNLTGAGGKELEYEWTLATPDPVILWHQLSFY